MKPRPSAVVEGMIASGQLAKVAADSALAEAILDKARGRLRSVQRALDAKDLGECAAPLWDATRLACAAILQAQGLRTQGEGHHINTINAVREQYDHLLGGLLKPANRLRDQRRDDEYPIAVAQQELNADDIKQDLEHVTQLVDAASLLIPLVPVYA